LPIASHPLIHVVAGGAERCDSVLNALHALRSTAAADDWVLVHDVARPCVDPNDIQRLIDTLASSDACGGILATPVRDTMKRADDQGCIQHSVERSGLWHALTPQMFRYGLLVTALQAACEAGVTITDEASALEWRGQHPRLIEGRPDNIKVTHPQDLALVALALSQQSGRYQ
jgi:2-C-methyl-D-erythritol 4-phosphate cytidylyltransferase